MKTHLTALLALLALAFPLSQARAKQPGPQMQRRPAVAAQPPEIIEEEIYDPAPQPGYGPHEHLDNCCNSCQSHDCCCDFGHWSAGYAFVLVQPHLEDDLAFTRTVLDGTFRSVTDATFDNDTELTPRAWLEYGRMNGLGVKATYWQFDHASPGRIDSPNPNGLETLASPGFGDVDLATGLPGTVFVSTATPGDVFTVDSDIDLEVVDFEGTKWTQFECWQLGATGGVRYASVTQGYAATVRDAAGVLQSSVNASHRFDGFGPTFSIEGRRPFGCALAFYSMARGSLLYGDGRAGFTIQDAGIVSRSSLERNDVVTVAEIQVGLEWRKQCCNGNMFFCRSALEGQVWQGAGSATSEEGDLGFFGFNIALGMSL